MAALVATLPLANPPRSGAVCVQAGRQALMRAALVSARLPCRVCFSKLSALGSRFQLGLHEAVWMITSSGVTCWFSLAHGDLER